MTSYCILRFFDSIPYKSLSGPNRLKWTVFMNWAESAWIEYSNLDLHSANLIHNSWMIFLYISAVRRMIEGEKIAKRVDKHTYLCLLEPLFASHSFNQNDQSAFSLSECSYKERLAFGCAPGCKSLKCISDRSYIRDGLPPQVNAQYESLRPLCSSFSSKYTLICFVRDVLSWLPGNVWTPTIEYFII